MNENGPLELFGGPFFRSARDADGHGTHTSSTAAGAPVANASFLGIGVGLAWGGALGACLAICKACWFSLCSDADLLSAFNDAIKDGVDIISISVGPTRLHLYRILVSASAGNSGLSGTASNVAPWMLTVAASSIDQRFDVNVVLGNSKVLKGMSLNPVGLKGSHALVPANAAAAPGVTSANASFCKPNTLNSAVVRRKIVICSIERIVDDRPAKAKEVQRAGGIWTILKDA